jgi:hypothetical protein
MRCYKVSFEEEKRWRATYKTMALAIERCVYPPIFEETVTSEMVKPTDWAFTSQKLTRRPQVLERGR